jgi:hypothetical protein
MEGGTQGKGMLIHQQDIRNAGYICQFRTENINNASVNGVIQQ